jgi:hypothetical protein
MTIIEKIITTQAFNVSRDIVDILIDARVARVGGAMSLKILLMQV